MEAVIAKKSVASVVWNLIKNNDQLLAYVFVLSHTVWWWFNAPTVLSTVTYCVGTAYLAGTAPKRWLMWAWLVLMLAMGAIQAGSITNLEREIVSNPVVVFCGNCTQ